MFPVFLKPKMNEIVYKHDSSRSDKKTYAAVHLVTLQSCIAERSRELFPVLRFVHEIVFAVGTNR